MIMAETKAIATRVPLETYVRLLDKVTSMKITMSDYLLMKLMAEPENKESGQIDRLKEKKARELAKLEKDKANIIKEKESEIKRLEKLVVEKEGEIKKIQEEARKEVEGIASLYEATLAENEKLRKTVKGLETLRSSK